MFTKSWAGEAGIGVMVRLVFSNNPKGVIDSLAHMPSLPVCPPLLRYPPCAGLCIDLDPPAEKSMFPKGDVDGSIIGLVILFSMLPISCTIGLCAGLAILIVADISLNGDMSESPISPAPLDISSMLLNADIDGLLIGLSAITSPSAPCPIMPNLTSGGGPIGISFLIVCANRCGAGLAVLDGSTLPN
jgi:hypothetical protein